MINCPDQETKLNADNHFTNKRVFIMRYDPITGSVPTNLFDPTNAAASIYQH